MTSGAHNKSKQHSLNAKVSFSLVIPYALCSLLSVTKLTLSQQASKKNSNFKFLAECFSSVNNLFWVEHFFLVEIFIGLKTFWGAKTFLKATYVHVISSLQIP